MVPQVTALLEDAITVFKAAFEEELESCSFRITHLHGFVPGLGDALKSLWIYVKGLADGGTFFDVFIKFLDRVQFHLLLRLVSVDSGAGFLYALTFNHLGFPLNIRKIAILLPYAFTLQFICVALFLFQRLFTLLIFFEFVFEIMQPLTYIRKL